MNNCYFCGPTNSTHFYRIRIYNNPRTRPMNSSGAIPSVDVSKYAQICGTCMMLAKLDGGDLQESLNSMLLEKVRRELKNV